MSKPFVIHLIHHSHTDIGYTDYQEKIELHHIYFIREAIDILNAAHSDRPEWLGFKWNCESFWCVEKFLGFADEKYRSDFIKYVRSGEIGLSGSYLNLTELVDDFVLNQTLEKCQRLASGQIGVPLRSALTADINGYSWGFADALAENGITRLISCIHTHHGYHPLKQKQTPFVWLSPKGNRVLVWNAEHYLLGNELGIARQSSFEYTIHDGLDHSEPDPQRKAERRIETYVNSLVEQGYPYSLVPVNISGMMTDNGFPNVSIVDFINEYNRSHDRIMLKMSTIDEFFDAAESEMTDLPVYSGDFTDWWADGIGSTPDVVQHSREASRKLYAVEKLDPEGKICGDIIDKARYNLIFYAEHTWGYASSVSEPWAPGVNKLDKRKALFACKANEYASRALDLITYAGGETPPSLLKDFKLVAINVHDRTVTDIIKISLENLFGHSHFKVIEADTGKESPYQIGRYARGPMLVLEVTLEPNSRKEYILKDVDPPRIGSVGRCADRGIEGVFDLSYQFDKGLALRGYTVSNSRIETPFFRIRMDESNGVVSIFDKTKNMELVKENAPYPPFTPIYEITRAESRYHQTDVRRRMGRNRKSTATERYIGKPCGINVTEQGPLSSTVEINYRLEGTEFCSLLITVFNNYPRIDFALRIHKKSVWDPENLYLALPFTAGEGEEFWIEKTGAILRPRIDQLPYTCTDFYALQSGMCFTGKCGSVIIATPDTPLITMGDLRAHEIVLSGEPGADNVDDVYSWVMNNFWETNFKVSLGGFHQFGYSLISTRETDPRDAISSAKEACLPPIGFCSFTLDK